MRSGNPLPPLVSGGLVEYGKLWIVQGINSADPIV